jgi:hypothetical protein
MRANESDLKNMAADLMLLPKEIVAAKCRELNIPPTDDKFKMIDEIIVTTFGIDACKRAFSRRS